jgi:hypothetical protein
MKVKYYRHSDLHKGFKLSEEMKIESKEKLKFNVEVEKVNSIYAQSMQKQTQYLMSQPNETDTLKQIVFLLVLPLLICLLLENFDFILV